ncbi:acyltransferase family protein [bacterium]|nr:acyltransferase family protein [bacterium]
MRRHDIDWIRIIALGMLIIYHAVIAFQPWGYLISFIQNEESLESLWLFMMIFNIWRIPILFMISGMGAYFALRNKNWKVFLIDRSVRILFPYIFGFFFICPITLFLAASFYGKQIGYFPNPGHLWFFRKYLLLCLALITHDVILHKKS